MSIYLPTLSHVDSQVWNKYSPEWFILPQIGSWFEMPGFVQINVFSPFINTFKLVFYFSEVWMRVAPVWSTVFIISQEVRRLWIM